MLRASLAAALVLLAGCAGGGERDRSATAPAPPAPDGYRVRSVPDAGVELALPRRWSALNAAEARSPGVVPTLVGADARLGRMVAALLEPGTPLKLVAFDRSSGVGFVPTITLLEIELDARRPFDRWSQEVLADVRRLDSVRGEVRSRRVELPLGEALRLEYVRAGVEGVERVGTVQYVVGRERRAYVLTLSTPPRRQAPYEDVVDAAARTLRPLA